MPNVDGCFTVTESIITGDRVIGSVVQCWAYFIRKFLFTASVLTVGLVTGPLAASALRALTAIKAGIGLCTAGLETGKSHTSAFQHLTKLSAGTGQKPRRLVGLGSDADRSLPVAQSKFDIQPAKLLRFKDDPHILAPARRSAVSRFTMV